MDEYKGNDPNKQRTSNSNNLPEPTDHKHVDKNVQQEEEEEDENKDEISKSVTNNNNNDGSIDASIQLKGTHLTETDTEEKANVDEYQIEKQIEKYGKIGGKQVTFKESIENLTIMMPEGSTSTIVSSQHILNHTKHNELEPISSTLSLNVPAPIPTLAPTTTSGSTMPSAPTTLSVTATQSGSTIPSAPITSSGSTVSLASITGSTTSSATTTQSAPITSLGSTTPLAPTTTSLSTSLSALTHSPTPSSIMIPSATPTPIPAPSLISTTVPTSTISTPSSSQDDTLLLDIPSKTVLTVYPRKLGSADDLLRSPIPTELEHMRQQQKYTHMILKKIERDNKEMAGHFDKIINMFDTFSKKLDALEFQLPTTSNSNSSSGGAITTRRKYIREPKVHVSRHAEYYSQVSSSKRPDTDEIEKVHITESLNVESGETTQKSKISEAPTEELSLEKAKSLRLEGKDGTLSSSIPVTMPVPITVPVSCASLSCQTSWHDTMSYSIISSSRNASPSNTSRSEIQNSLNNFAEPDAAIVVSSQAQLITHDIQRVQTSSQEKLIPRPVQPNTNQVATTAAVQLDETSVQPCNQQYHTIHIDAPSSPPSSIVQRPSLCSRLWDSICDMCAAVCVCLQVNRDCIFCLGFFAAFVVSASFLTAFFYRTLSVSSTMPSPTNQPLDHTNADLMEHFNGYFRQVTVT